MSGGIAGKAVAGRLPPIKQLIRPQAEIENQTTTESTEKNFPDRISALSVNSVVKNKPEPLFFYVGLSRVIY